MGKFIGYSFSFVVLLGVLKNVTKHMIISLGDLFEWLYVNFYSKKNFSWECLVIFGFTWHLIIWILEAILTLVVM
jgi:hypothetical protein